MKKYNHYLLLAVSLFVFACNNTDKKKDQAQKEALADTVKTTDVVQINTNDMGFVNAATQGSMLEIQLGQLAERNALNQQVKEFGNMMVKDHTKASTELKKISGGKKLSQPITLDKDTQDRVDSLSLQSSAGFDLKFMDIMVAAHKKDVAAFEHATTALQDPDLKAFAVKTLPVLKMHLTAAEKLNTDLNKKNAANNTKK